MTSVISLVPLHPFRRLRLFVATSVCLSGPSFCLLSRRQLHVVEPFSSLAAEQSPLPIPLWSPNPLPAAALLHCPPPLKQPVVRLQCSSLNLHLPSPVPRTQLAFFSLSSSSSPPLLNLNCACRSCICSNPSLTTAHVSFLLIFNDLPCASSWSPFLIFFSLCLSFPPLPVAAASPLPPKSKSPPLSPSSTPSARALFPRHTIRRNGSRHRRLCS